MQHYCRLPDFRVLPWILIITFCFSSPLSCLSQIRVHRHLYTHRWMDVKFSRISHVVVMYLITKRWQFPSGNWNRLYQLGVLFKICHIPWLKLFCDGKDRFVLPQSKLAVMDFTAQKYSVVLLLKSQGVTYTSRVLIFVVLFNH